MVLEQTFELRIQFLIVLDAVHVMPLHHPLDVQGRQGNAERIMRQNFFGDSRGWSDHLTHGAKTCLEFAPEPLEQLDVLGFFARELQQRARAKVVRLKLLPRLVEHERQDKLFNEPKNAEVRVASDLVEHELLIAVKKCERLNAGESFRHKRFREIQPFTTSDDVLDAPAIDL